MMDWFSAAQQFHFLRPYWLLALLPAIALAWLLLRRHTLTTGWQGAIRAELLQHLCESEQGKTSRLPLLGLLLAWLIAVLALAGPSWNKLPQPVQQRQDALVVVLDLSLSMLAEDIKPSRLTRAKHKVLDTIAQRREGLTALVAYSGDAHVVAPLTDDTATIANLVPALSPLMMPVTGSNPVAAIRAAIELLHNAGMLKGRLLLVTDGVTTDDINAVSAMERQGVEIAVMGIGTAEGAPIPADKGYLKNSSGNIIVPKLERANLRALADRTGGRYSDLRLDGSDLSELLNNDVVALSGQQTGTEREFDQWRDRGPLLSALLLPFALAAFRRGWLLGLLLPLLFLPNTGNALEWQDLWQRPDQQGIAKLEAGDAKGAAALFDDPDWRASANYRAGDYRAAAENLAGNDSADAHYNRGNALAKDGKYQEAIAAYDRALEAAPTMEDASFNRTLIEKLLQQQQNQQNQQNSQDNRQSGSQQSSAQQQSGDASKGNGNNGDSTTNPEQDSPQQGGSSASDPTASGGQSAANSDNASQSSDADHPTDSASGAPSPSEPQLGDTDQSPSPQSSAEAAGSEHQQLNQQPQQQPQSAEQSAATDANGNTAPDAADDRVADTTAGTDAPADAQTEQQRQATEQWLRQIPDDPSGLLRRKFYYESQLRQQQRGQQQAQQQEQPLW